MAKPRMTPEEMASRARAAAAASTQEAIPESEEVRRRHRTKRPGLLAEDTVNVCFRLERSRALKLKADLVSQGKEIGEFFDDLLRAQGF
ncbi:hypothetical protein [Azospirillum sp. Sh1]|uniref:hypothetical protein n=1 Tax=Azospirillum sp. Sh1 TaxID=2607285 RepID=UPI0011EF5A27|nr:hypothetical protein [Azospirillum sp. Sh1]KAA0573408.1 hypothetical protein FZ029_20740 [Azospirillum sp. Sh1]